MHGETGPGGPWVVLTVTNLRSAWPILTLQQKCRQGSRLLQGREGSRSKWRQLVLRKTMQQDSCCQKEEAEEGEDPQCMMMICRPIHSLSLFVSLFLSLSLWCTRSLLFSFFFPLSLFWCLSFAHTHIHTTRFWMRGGGLRGTSQSVGYEFPGISLFKTLFLLMFGKVRIYLNTYPFVWSQVYPPSNKCHVNEPFLRVRYHVKKRQKVT